MANFDKYNLASDLDQRYWQLDPATGLVLPGAMLFDEFGQIYNRTNPVAVELLPKSQFFGDIATTPLGSAQMAGDFRFVGTPIEVHNGTDNVYWTGANIVGASVTFNDTTQAFDGTRSILVNGMSVGNVFELDSTTTIDLSGHAVLELRVWVTANYTPSDIITIEGWDSGTASIVGVAVNLGDFIEESSVAQWQSAEVLTSLMGLSTATITGLRFRQVAKSGPAPVLHLDAIKFQEAGGPSAFTVAAPPGFRFRITGLLFTVTDVFTLAATNNGSYGIPPLGFMGVPTLANGILAAQVVDGVFGVQAIWNNYRDMAKFGYFPEVPLTDGTTTSITIARMFSTPIVIEGPAALNNLQIIFSDDTSGWDDAVGIVVGTIEPIT